MKFSWHTIPQLSLLISIPVGRSVGSPQIEKHGHGSNIDRSSWMNCVDAIVNEKNRI